MAAALFARIGDILAIDIPSRSTQHIQMMKRERFHSLFNGHAQMHVVHLRLLRLGFEKGCFADLKRVSANINLVDATGYSLTKVFIAGATAAMQH